jgi:hypothetical protein
MENAGRSSAPGMYAYLVVWGMAHNIINVRQGKQFSFLLLKPASQPDLVSEKVANTI